jgi:hypothetical protein
MGQTVGIILWLLSFSLSSSPLELNKNISETLPLSDPHLLLSPTLEPTIQRICVFDGNNYQQITDFDQISSLNTTRVLYTEILGPSTLKLPNITTRYAQIRSQALLVEIEMGIVYLSRNGRAVHLDPLSNTSLSLGVWENTLPTKTDFDENLVSDSRQDLPCTTPLLRVPGTVISFLTFGEVFSHIAAAILPKLYFTCDLFTQSTSAPFSSSQEESRLRSELVVLVPNELAKQMILWVCPAAQTSHFIFPPIGSTTPPSGSWAMQADRLLWPFYFTPKERRREEEESRRGEEESQRDEARQALNDISHLPNGTLRSLSRRPRPQSPSLSSSLSSSSPLSSSITPSSSPPQASTSNQSSTLRKSRSHYLRHRRTIVFIPRLYGTARYLEGQYELLTQVCRLISSSSRYEVRVFIPTNIPDKDRHNIILQQAKVIISPHSGALANILFVPNDAMVLEISNLEIENWFYVTLASVLGLRYRNIPARDWDHSNVTMRARVDLELFREILMEAIPEIEKKKVVWSQKDRAHIQRCLHMNLEKLVNYQ